MNNRLYYDTETLGFCGPIVLLQYAIGTGPITLFEPWQHRVKDTLDLIESIMLHPGGVVGWNLSFDHFQMCKLYCLFLAIEQKYGPEKYAIEIDPEELLDLEESSLGLATLRPVTALDLMIFVQKGPYQKCMEREEIRIKRVPGVLAPELAALMNENVSFEPILFGNRVDKNAPIWHIGQSTDYDGNAIEGMYDVFCKFHPSFKLKDVAVDIGLAEETDRYIDVGIPADKHPTELGFAPYGKALYNVEKEHWKLVTDFVVRKNKTKKAEEKLKLPYYGTWVHFLKYHVDFWHNNKEARHYAYNDVVYTRGVDEHFKHPEMGDDDSILACCVAACRLKGYNIDLEGLRELKKSNLEKQYKRIKYSNGFSCTVNDIFGSQQKSLDYVSEPMSEVEKVSLPRKTDKVSLEKFEARGDEVGRRAREILDGRKAKKENEVIDKLIIARRFHASFIVIGTLSSRMSGSDGLNPQGINKKKYFRGKFPLAFPGYTLCGGDFSSFEVTIFEAVSNDPRLRADLLTGKKIHGLFGTFVYPDMTYDQIVASSGTKDDRYTKSKSALFAMLYGGEARTLMTRLGVKLEDAQAAYDRFLDAYPGAKAERMRIKDDYSPLQQSDDGKIHWTDFKEYVESLYGFKRYFTIEFYAVRALFNLAAKLPLEWQRIDGACVRNQNKGRQTYSGAIMSALYSSSFNIQSSVFRQAANHRIQSTGAQVTKKLERRIWELQPAGANIWCVQPMNVHDEIMCPALEEYVPKIRQIVTNLIEEVKPVIPLVGIEWSDKLETWASK